jgi:hypothetical protein
MIRSWILLFTVCLCTISADAQVSESIYDNKQLGDDFRKLGKVFDLSGKTEIDERKLDTYIRKNILLGENSTRDSIAFLSIKRTYYLNTQNVVNLMYSQLKLVAFYSAHLTNSELESLYRKIGEAYFFLGNFELAREFLTRSLE